jgi:hypothetical protein
MHAIQTPQTRQLKVLELVKAFACTVRGQFIISTVWLADFGQMVIEGGMSAIGPVKLR